ncbi:unnamed protein product [Prorocentrum cordatum]|uniref:Uncharacterized protein n=1 Tax=Prorocentrum cordatum TaxID=2364126 RepID=A0ABN9T881_9DINO|nr:unnamed protein product [Polarella glacialis]
MALQRSQRVLFEVSSSDELTCTVLTAAMPSSEPCTSYEGGSPGKPAARAAGKPAAPREAGSFPARAAIGRTAPRPRSRPPPAREAPPPPPPAPCARGAGALSGRAPTSGEASTASLPWGALGEHAASLRRPREAAARGPSARASRSACRRGLGGALPKLVPDVPAGAEGDCEQKKKKKKHPDHGQDVAGATSREVTSRQLFHAASI